MDWLYQRYWMAQMQSTLNDPMSEGTEELSESQKVEMARLLTLYKRLQKEGIRDASVSKTKDIAKVTQAIERWIIDIGTSKASLANSASNKARSAADASSVGCQALSQIMVETGYLVPTSKKSVYS